MFYLQNMNMGKGKSDREEEGKKDGFEGDLQPCDMKQKKTERCVRDSNEC